MSADTPYVALSRLRFGDGFIQPGEPVPVEPGRNYAQMMDLGQIAFSERALRDGLASPAQPRWRGPERVGPDDGGPVRVMAKKNDGANKAVVVEPHESHSDVGRLANSVEVSEGSDDADGSGKPASRGNNRRK